MSVTTFCLECERELDLGKQPWVGQRVKCEVCEVQLEIINIDPLELDWVYDRGTSQSGFMLPDSFDRSLPEVDF